MHASRCRSGNCSAECGQTSNPVWVEEIPSLLTMAEHIHLLYWGFSTLERANESFHNFTSLLVVMLKWIHHHTCYSVYQFCTSSSRCILNFSENQILCDVTGHVRSTVSAMSQRAFAAPVTEVFSCAVRNQRLRAPGFVLLSHHHHHHHHHFIRSKAVPWYGMSIKCTV